MCEQGMKAATIEECAPGSQTEKVPNRIEELARYIGKKRHPHSLDLFFKIAVQKIN